MSVTIQDAPDYTGNVYIVGQLQDLTITGSVTVTSGDVNIVGPLTDTGYVAISIRESVQLDVNVTNTTLNITGDVTVSSGSVDISGPLTNEGNVAVAIQQSIQLDVNVTNSVINIQGSVDANITNATLTIQGDVNVTNSVLNVSITNEVLQGKLAKPALAFNGENAYVRVPYSSSLDDFTELTVEVGLRLDRLGSEISDWQRLVNKEAWPSDGNFLLAQHYSDKLVFYIHDAGTVYTVYSNTVLEKGRFYVVAGLYDGADIKVAVNGVIENTKDVPNGITLSYAADLIISDSPKLKGLISFVRLYNRALSSDELQHNYNNPQSPVTDGLVLWLNFDEGSGTTAYDKSGNGNHGTIYNAVWVSEQGQTSPLLAVNITASQVTMDVNITDSVQLDININAQNIGVYLVESWVAKQVTDINLYGFAHLGVDGSGSLIAYEIPEGKSLYVSFVSVTPRGTGLNYLASLYVSPADVTYITIGNDRVHTIEFHKPIRIDGPNIVYLNIQNLSNTEAYFYGTILGWLE